MLLKMACRAALELRIAVRLTVLSPQVFFTIDGMLLFGQLVRKCLIVSGRSQESHLPVSWKPIWCRQKFRRHFPSRSLCATQTSYMYYGLQILLLVLCLDKVRGRSLVVISICTQIYWKYHSIGHLLHNLHCPIPACAVDGYIDLARESARTRQTNTPNDHTSCTNAHTKADNQRSVCQVRALSPVFA